MERRRALITGVSGQDGSYLADQLLEDGYEVHGIVRRQSVAESQTARLWHLDDVHERFHTHYGDVTDAVSVYSTMLAAKPHEVYNLAAQSHVWVSFKKPWYTAHVNALGALNVLEITRQYQDQHAAWRVRFYQASSSEMFGNTIPSGKAADEETLMRPVSPYGCAKLFAYNMVRSYREGYGLHASNGILFNHSSPRRGRNFVEAKIVDGLLRRKFLNGPKLVLGNLDSVRDIGYSAEYVAAMQKIVQQDKPGDYVIGTGIIVSVLSMTQYVVDCLQMGTIAANVETTDRYKRPAELHYLRADASKAKHVLGWEPKLTWQQLLDLMLRTRAEELGVAGRFKAIINGARR